MLLPILDTQHRLVKLEGGFTRIVSLKGNESIVPSANPTNNIRMAMVPPLSLSLPVSLVGISMSGMEAKKPLLTPNIATII